MKCLTLVSRFFRILKSELPDTRAVGRFPDVIRGVISVRHFIKYPAYLRFGSVVSSVRTFVPFFAVLFFGR